MKLFGVGLLKLRVSTMYCMLLLPRLLHVHGGAQPMVNHERQWRYATRGMDCPTLHAIRGMGAPLNAVQAVRYSTTRLDETPATCGSFYLVVWKSSFASCRVQPDAAECGLPWTVHVTTGFETAGLAVSMAEEATSMSANESSQCEPIRTRQAAYCLQGTMMERARHSDVGDGDLREPHVLAMEQLLRCNLVTEANKEFCLVNDHQLVVAQIQACVSVPCLAPAVWPLIESLGNDQDTLAMVDWVRCAKLRCYPAQDPDAMTKPWFQWIVGVPDKEGNTGLMMLWKRNDSWRILEVFDRYADVCNPEHANTDGNTVLMLAIQPGTFDVAAKLITKFGMGCMPRQANKDGNTALMIAILRGPATLASKIITTFGINCMPGHANADGNTALMMTLQRRSDEAATELIKTFGANCVPGHVNKDGNTALMLACRHKRFESAKALIKTFGDECDFGHINKEGNTALVLAMKTYSTPGYHFSSRQTSELVAVFGQLGVACAPGHANHDANTALMVACSTAWTSATALVEAFGDACKPGHINTEGETALMRAGLGVPVDARRIFRGFNESWNPGYANGDGNTALMLYCKRAKFHMATALLAAFGDACDPGHRNNNGRTALMLAVSNCRRESNDVRELCEALSTRCRLACAPGHTTSDGNTVLMQACKEGQWRSAAALIEAFGDACEPGHTNQKGETALMLAMSTDRFGYRCHAATRASDEADGMCHLIPKFGGFGVACAPGHANNDGNTALMIACKRNHLHRADVLLKVFGVACVPGHVNREGQTALHWISVGRGGQGGLSTLLARFGALNTSCAPGHAERHGNTALMLACKKRNFDVAEALIEAFSDACNPGLVNKDGDTALTLAMGTLMSKYDEQGNAVSLVRKFGEFGVACAPGHSNKRGNTALMVACHLQRFNWGKALLRTFGAACAPGHINRNGVTALMQLVSENYANGAEGTATARYASMIEALGLFGATCVPGHVNSDDDTALMLAWKNKQFGIAVALIEAFGAGPFMDNLTTCRSQLLDMFQVENFQCDIATRDGMERGVVCNQALAAMRLAQTVMTAAEIDTFRLDLLKGCSPPQGRFAHTLVSGISTICRPEQWHAVVHELRERWTHRGWSSVLLAVLAKLVELGCTSVPTEVRKAVKLRVMQLAIEKDEGLTLRLLDILTPFTSKDHRRILNIATCHGRQRVVDRLGSTDLSSACNRELTDVMQGRGEAIATQRCYEEAGTTQRGGKITKR